MKVRRRLTGVLCGFIDAFVSRNSDYDGYWIFGLLVRESNEILFDLLHSNSDREKSPVLSAAAQAARSNFARQLEKSRIPAEFVSEGKVMMSKLEPARGAVNGRPSDGHVYSVQAEATSDLGKKYTARKRIFIAPHDPSVEHRSTRGNG
jgi:hypothetical protein